MPRTETSPSASAPEGIRLTQNDGRLAKDLPVRDQAGRIVLGGVDPNDTGAYDEEGITGITRLYDALATGKPALNFPLIHAWRTYPRAPIDARPGLLE